MHTIRRRAAGHAVIEAALIAPWIFFLFVGTFDFGFYAQALIATENAARVAVFRTSASAGAADDTAGACAAALAELQRLPNIAGQVSSCGALPVRVTAQSITGADGTPASQVSVTYQTIPLIPIPLLLNGRVTITRTVQAKVDTTS